MIVELNLFVARQLCELNAGLVKVHNNMIKINERYLENYVWSGWRDCRRWRLWWFAVVSCRPAVRL